MSDQPRTAEQYLSDAAEQRKLAETAAQDAKDAGYEIARLEADTMQFRAQRDDALNRVQQHHTTALRYERMAEQLQGQS